MKDEYEAWVEPVKVRMGRPVPVSPEDFGVCSLDVGNVIWFDPGMTVGWCVISVWTQALECSKYRILNNIAGWSVGEFVGSESEVVDQMVGLVEAWEDDKLRGVGIEDFILRKFSMGRELLSPVRVTSRFEDRMYTGGRSQLLLPKQQADLAMSTVTDERLKRWGLYVPTVGKEHARDALRHALTWLKRLKSSAR